MATCRSPASELAPQVYIQMETYRALQQLHQQARGSARIQRVWRGYKARQDHSEEVNRLAKMRARRKGTLRKTQAEGRRRGLYQPTGCPATRCHRARGPAGSSGSAPVFQRDTARGPAATAAAGPVGPTSASQKDTTRSQAGTSGSAPVFEKDTRFNHPWDVAKLRPRVPPPQIGSPRIGEQISTAERGRVSPCDAAHSQGTSSSSTAMAAGAHMVRSLRAGMVPVDRLTRSAPAAERSAGVDVSNLLSELTDLGLLSSVHKEPQWQQSADGVSDLEVVSGWIKSHLPTVEVRTILRVECTLASAAYDGVRSVLGPERLLWHGTSWESVANIVRHGFNRAYGGRHGARLGRGTYFAEDPGYALRFCGRTPRTRALFLAGVLPGRCCRGEDGLVEPPQADATGARYDSTVDDPERPRVFCVFRDFQALPLYLAEVAN